VSSRRRLLGGVAALVVGSAGLLGAGAGTSADPASDASPPPSQWPATPALTARQAGAANGLRLWGPDRYQTSLALALSVRGLGQFPFGTPDRTSGGAGSLSSANGWWGVGVCPRSVIVVAGDAAADALAASALSDPTDQSTEPLLQRTAAADPLFDPVGGFTRVDTEAAPILVTRSARDGATALSPAARRAAQDLRAGGCTTARQAIVVGGTAAVPAGVDDELLGLGYDEVFRVQGANRYATAAAVARSLGTADRPPGVTACADPQADDGTVRMTFYANSVVEYRPSATSCEVLGRTVVLADGVTGADALAAGWWTSFWQTPVLLHDGSGSLPPATADELSTLAVDHLVVLGGTARIPESVVNEAVALTGAEVRRVAGSDRYETSVQMAQVFGGWWPTGRGQEFRGSLVCLAASSGDAADARGWPDALSAGPWCGAANGAARAPGAPDRALAPTTGRLPVRSSTVGSPGRDGQGHDAVPILLVPFGASTLPSSVSTLLSEAFDPGDTWCTSVAAPSGCLAPGFAIALGGPAALADGVLEQASRLVSGSSTLESGMAAPGLGAVFATGLDLTPVHGVSGSGAWRVCAPRAGYQGARWLAVFTDATVARVLAHADVMMAGRYVTDADGVERSPGTGAPQCVTFDPAGRTEVAVRAVGLAGRAGATQVVSVDDARRFAVVDPLTASGPVTASGVASDLDDSNGGSTLRSFTTVAPNPAVTVTQGSQSTTVNSATLTFTLVRGTNTATSSGADLFTASWTITTPLGTVAGSANGEAILDGSTWELRGVSSVTGGSWNVGTGAGGFTASLSTNSPGDASDDAISWQVDAVLAP
jgi:hypothetical protein